MIAKMKFVSLSGPKADIETQCKDRRGKYDSENEIRQSLGSEGGY